MIGDFFEYCILLEFEDSIFKTYPFFQTDEEIWIRVEKLPAVHQSI